MDVNYRINLWFDHYYPHPIVIETNMTETINFVELYYSGYIERDSHNHDEKRIRLFRTETGIFVSCNYCEDAWVPSRFATAVLIERIDRLIFSPGNPIYKTHWGIHAAAVEFNGKVVLISGATQSGKSTLTAYLASRGLRYLTDDVVFISKNACLGHPFVKPLHFRVGVQPLFRKIMPELWNKAHPIVTDENWFIPNADLGVKPHHNLAFPIATILFVRYGARNSLRKLSGPEKLVNIMKNSMPQSEVMSVKSMATALARTVVWSLEYSHFDFVDTKLLPIIYGLSPAQSL